MLKRTTSLTILVTSLIIVSIIYPGCIKTSQSPNHYQPVVQKLERLIVANATLRTEIAKALAERDVKSFWYQRTIPDLLDFFNEWLTYPPKPDDVRKHMDTFYDFANSSMGRKTVITEPLKSWLYEYIMEIGKFMDSKESTTTLSSWLNDPRIRMDEYIIPQGGFNSFNEFFIRTIKTESRPIDSLNDKSILISPADSSLIRLSDNITAEANIGAKGANLNIIELLGGDDRAGKFINGKAILCMLDTTDYHHFHAPVDGKIVSSRQMAGLYYGMTGGWVDYFFEHRRGYYIFDTEKYGHVGMVCIGMFTISSINLLKSEGKSIKKGDELGYFAYGGSAIILLFEPDHVTFSLPTAKGPPHMLMGQKIGILNY